LCVRSPVVTAAPPNSACPPAVNTQLAEAAQRLEVGKHYGIPYPRLHHSPEQFKRRTYMAPPQMPPSRRGSKPAAVARRGAAPPHGRLGTPPLATCNTTHTALKAPLALLATQKQIDEGSALQLLTLRLGGVCVDV
jgi:hypothetical protein